MRTLTKLSLIVAATLTTATVFADLTDVHPAGSPGNSTWTNGVSSDGLVSVGRSNIGGGSKAFKIVGGSYTQLNNLGGGFGSWATAASSTGSLIVGTSIDFNGADQAVSWAGVTPTLLDSGAILSSSSATGVSANGSVIVGYGFDATTSFVDKAFYHQTGVLNLITAMGAGNANRATGISANGNLIVGTESNDFNNATSSSGFIHTVGGTSTLVQADSAITAFNTAGLSFTQLTAISGNGAIAIGYASSSLNPGDEQAFKYNVSGATYAALGSLSVGGWSIARAINSDGSVIVGQSDNQAFKYQDGTLTPLGFLGTGNESDATGVSADGKVIVGYSRITNAGTIRHAFVYANQTMLDADEWLLSLNGPVSILAMTTSLNSQPLEGAHHRPLMSYDNMGKQSQAWATGDFGTSSRQSDSHMTSGEIGVSGTFSDFVLGVAAGHASLNQDLLFGGSAHISGNYLLAEADYRLADKESIVSLVLVHGNYDADTSRGYATGSGTDTSRGTTGLKTSSARLRFDGPAQNFISAVSATPFISYTVTRTTADAYAETGGSFPASFGAQEHTAQEGRLGVTAKYVASPSTTLLFTAEWIHRFDGAGDGLTATNATLGTLTAAGIAPTADQARFGFDIDHKLSADTLLNFSVHAAGIGPSSDVSAALSIRRAF
jgi:probable HAF family extracellular repeat protein